MSGRAVIASDGAAGTCGELVALYKPGDYRHHGQGIESCLRSRGTIAAVSGRMPRTDFERMSEEAIAHFDAILELLGSEGDDD